MTVFSSLSDHLTQFFHKKLARDLLWTYTALSVTLLTGILVNILILFFYNPAVLGAFNINYSLYFVAIQLFGWGVQASVLNYASQQQTEKEQSVIILSAACISFFTGALGVFLLFFFTDSIAFFFSSELTGSILNFSLIGIWLYAVNKCILFSFNAIRYMKIYSSGQLIRALIFSFVVLFLCVREYDPAYLGLSFSLAEIILFIYLSFCLVQHTSFSFTRERFFFWVKKHLHFGSHSFLGALFVDLHARLDVLMLGFFALDTYVGIYSLAAMVAEGLVALITVLRTNVTPLLTTPLLQKDYGQIRTIFRTARFWARIIAAGISSTILGVFFLWGYLYWPQHETMAFFSLLILLVGVCVYAGYIPVSFLFNQAGRPGVQTIYFGGCVFFNALGNLCFIPLYGPYGAALGTSLSYLAAIIFFSCLTRYTLGFSLHRTQ